MRRSFALALLLASACSIELAPRPRPPEPPARSTHLGLVIGSATLPSGLRVVTVRDPRATEVQVTMRYQVGAAADDSHPGLAHLVEHLMFQQELDGQPLFTHVEDIATYFNAATTFDATTYTARGPTSALDKLLAFEAIRLEDRCKTVTEAAFTRERQVVLNELELRDHTSELLRAIHVALYPDGHPYRQMVGGNAATVGAIAREQACAFADMYYAPNNAVLVVSGPLSQVELDAALAKVSSRITKRSGTAARKVPAVATRPLHVEVPAPIDQDVLVVTWPLPLEPQLQANVLAIGSVLPRLVDKEIKGGVLGIELGDTAAPMFGIAVVPGDDETFKQALDGTHRGVENLPSVFRDSEPTNVDQLVFDRLKQGAIYNLYSGLEDGSDRDEQLATIVLAGRDPRAAVTGQIAALGDLSRSDAAELASRYFAVNTPTVVTLKANAGKKRGDKVTLRAPIHDFGQRRTSVDPALANRPAPLGADELAGAQTFAQTFPKTRVLRNGLKVVLLPVTTVPTFEARLIFGAGTADEPGALTGVALVAAHTLTWDLHHLRDVIPFLRAGGMRNTDVGTDHTSFSVQGLDMNFDVVLAGLRRWVRDGVYDDSAANFVEAMRRAAKRADDQGVLTDTWRASLFGANHPYVKAGLVRHATHTLTLADARGFRNAHYTPDNATLVIAGRFDAALADHWIDYLFADWTGRASGHNAVSASSQPASIAMDDDTTLVQLRFAIPTKVEGRAQRLVTAAMLSDIAQDVRHRLGASYTFDAKLDETRLASFYLIGGFVDATRTKAAVELVDGRIRELHRDATAAARAFVTARSHVITQLRSRIGSASALADRVERDVEMARTPMSDLQTAMAVSALTIADMNPALAELDLARATMLFDGPAGNIEPALAALGRKLAYVRTVKTAAPASSSDPPGTRAPSFAADEQRVWTSQLVPSLTAQPMPRLQWVVSASTGVASTTGIGEAGSGLSLAGDVGYRYGWSNAIGLHTSIGRFAGVGTASSGSPMTLTLVPINLLGAWHLGTMRRSWGDVMLGVHIEHLGGDWRTAPLFALQGGYDLIGRFGIALRYEQAVHSGLEYGAILLGLAYRH